VPNLITIDEAVRLGITKLRAPHWADRTAHIEISVHEVDGKNVHGPWVRLYDPSSQESLGEPTPQKILWFAVFPPGSNTLAEWEVYKDPSAEPDRQAQA
jgi:hypothetical protein